MEQQGHSSGLLPYSNSYHMMTAPPSGTDLFAYQQPQEQPPEIRQQLQNLWSTQHREMEKSSDMKNHSLPLARIKKIMKADGDVRMISAEAPVIFARACEMFILELTLRSWTHAEENRRRTLQKNDIAASISRTAIFDFLVDVVPKDDTKDPVTASIPQEYYQYAGNPGGMAMGTPVTVMDPSLYGQQSHHAYMGQPMWPSSSDK